MDSKSVIIGLLAGVAICLGLMLVNDTTQTAYGQVSGGPRYQICSVGDKYPYAALVIDQFTGDVFGLTSREWIQDLSKAAAKKDPTFKNVWYHVTGAPN